MVLHGGEMEAGAGDKRGVARSAARKAEFKTETEMRQ